MEYSQQLTNNEQQSDSYKIDSIPHITAVEERALWRKYIKLRHIRGILTSEGVLDDIREASPPVISLILDNIHEVGPPVISLILDNMPEASSIVFSRIIQEISSSQDLIVLLRRHAELDKLGDTIIEDDAENKFNIMIELYRLIQYSKKKHDEKIKQNNSETCCLEDLFGFILGEILNNIAFGKGNPALVDRIAKVINREPAYIEDKLFKLAVNRELLPKSLINLLNPKTPLNKLPSLIKSIPPDIFSEFVSNYYQPFIMNIKAEGEKAFDRIIESHLWLVVDIVNKHFDIEEVGLPRDDLIQEGSLGLIEAAERFQPTLSSRFMQYAHFWIYQKINRAIADQARTIRVPVHMIETINKLLRVSRCLAQEYGREPTPKEIGEVMEMPPEKVREIAKVAQIPISLESPIGEEDSHLGDFIEDQGTLSPVDVAAEHLLKEKIEEILSTLTPQEQRVLHLRFGLDDGRSRTLEEVGQEFNLTRERIRQIEAKALKKLRHPSRSRKLKGYLE